jgi:hypothetical protein
MLRRFGLALATITLLPAMASAQKGQQIFDLFLQGAQQEILRQQQREHERQQRQQLQGLHQLRQLCPASGRMGRGAFDPNPDSNQPTSTCN